MSGWSATRVRPTWNGCCGAWTTAAGSRKPRPRVAVEPYSYALWRVVPRLDRGEQVNVGLVLYSRRHRFLDALTHVSPERLALLGDVDVAAVEANLAMRVAVAHGDAGGGGAVAAM